MIRNIIIIFVFYSAAILPQFLGPKVSVQQLEFDFGDIGQDKLANHSFVISNSGDDVLIIKDVKASCGCTAAKPDKNELKPKESTKIAVSFNPKGRKGPQVKIITVSTNDPEKPKVLLTIKSNVIVSEKKDNKAGAMIYLPETQHDFGKVKEGEKIAYTFKLENKGSESLIVKNVKSSCGCTAAVVNNKTIEPNKSGSIKVEFDTKNRSGKNTKTVTIVSNDTNEPNKVITIFAEVIKK